MARAVKFDLLSQEHRRDPFPGLARLREAGPVVPVRFPVIGTLHVVTTHAAVEALLKNPADFSVDIAANGRSRLAFLLKWMPRTLRILANNMLQKDDPEHRRLRKLVDAAFRRTAVEEWRPRVERLAARHLDRLEASASRDLVEHVARPLPLSVICEILGLPEADQPQFLRWMADVAKPDSLIGALRIFPALRRINAYMRERIAERRAVPRDDLISVLVAAEIDGDRLSDDDLLAMCFLLFAAGHETTTHLISGGVLALLQNPEELARLRHDPALMPAAVDELLRHVSPVEFSKPRFPRREMDLAGVPVRPGMQLMASIAAANSDPAVFERPERLDLSRGGNRHLGLGTGPHFCLGAWLAKLEVEVLLRQLLVRAPDLRLGVPEDDLRWSERPGFRALQALPLAYTPAR